MMDTARQHWEILRRVPDELARRVRAYMVIGDRGDGVLLATESGDGYWLGDMKFGEESQQALEPARLDVPKLASMAHGHSHILLLDKEGQIHSMGRNDVGQFGQGTVDGKSHFAPQLISSSHKFISVRCGLWHSLALTEDGKVWSWGNNNCGQVGVPTSTANPHPSLHQISELDSHRVVAIECGGFYSLVLTDQGEVYAWGWNDWGKLANENGVMNRLCQLHSPTRIPTPSPVKSIAAGHSHTLLLTQTGGLYACGDNGSCQLGLPNATKSSSSLVKIAGLPAISHIASHFQTHMSIAMSDERECFIWGYLGNNLFTSTPFKLPPNYSTLDSVLSFRSTQRNTPYSVRVKGLQCSQRMDSQTESLTGISRLGDRASRMFDNSDSNSDVKFKLGDQSILAHRSVLQISSGYFERFFSKYFISSNGNSPNQIPQSSHAQQHNSVVIRPMGRISPIFDNSDSNPGVKFELGEQTIMSRRSPISPSGRLFLNEPSSSVNFNNNQPSPNSPFSPLSHSTNPSEPNLLQQQIAPIFITISILGYSYPTFHAYLHFLYTGTFEVSSEHLTELFELARSYLESDLEQLCLARMRSTVSLENCCLYYQLTERHPQPEFQEELVQFIADNSFQVFLTAAYQSMDGDLCKKLTISIAKLWQ